jgi:hypothetical protein
LCFRKQELVERLDRLEVDRTFHMPARVLVVEAAVDDVVPRDLRAVFAL